MSSQAENAVNLMIMAIDTKKNVELLRKQLAAAEARMQARDSEAAEAFSALPEADQAPVLASVQAATSKTFAGVSR